MKIIKALVYSVVIVVAALSLFTVFSINTPLQPFVVLSGSMRPTVPEGSLVFVRRNFDQEVKIGDVITFKKPGNVEDNVTHRVVESFVLDGKTVYKTKGDANNAQDQWFVRREAIWGKMAFSIPLLGFIVNFAKTKLGVLLVIVLPLGVIIFDEVRVIWKEIKVLQEKKKHKETEKIKEEEEEKKNTEKLATALASKHTLHASHTSKKKKKVLKHLAILVALFIGMCARSSSSTYALFNDTVDVQGQKVVTSWWVPPTVQLISPNGGQTLYQGNNYSIQWTAASNDPSSTVMISLYYSTDGGATYPNVIATSEANDGIYSWTAPNTFENDVRVRVVATDTHSLTNNDDSNANFSIVSPIVMNEFLPNPIGDDAAAKPSGEWVELRNNGSVSVDVNGWALYDDTDTHELVIAAANADNNGNPTDAGETVVAPGGFLVVYRNSDTDFELANSGSDAVRLYNAPIGSGVLIDAYAYTFVPTPENPEIPENKSYARIPDGTGPWIDPDPTPGAPNTTTEGYLSLLIQVSADTSAVVPEEVQVSESPEPSSTPTPSPASTPEPTPSPVSSPSPEPTEVPEPTSAAEEGSGTPGESPEPSVEPSLSPSPSPSAESQEATEISVPNDVESTPEPGPTPSPSPEPTPEPALEPTPTPEPSPTVQPIQPTPSSTPSPEPIPLQEESSSESQATETSPTEHSTTETQDTGTPETS